MADFSDFMAELKQKRDEVRLQLHLGTKEAEEEWEELMMQWHKFISATQLEKSSEEIGEAARQLGLKTKAAYDRFKKALD